jgi:hypothetical protein
VCEPDDRSAPDAASGGAEASEASDSVRRELAAERTEANVNERLLAILPVTFAKRRTVDAGTFGLPPESHDTNSLRLSRGPTLSSIGAYRRWSADATSAGFPVAGMAMVLGLTERHLTVFSSKFFRSRPKRRAGAVLLSDIAQMTALRGVFTARVVVLLNDGSIVELETMRAGRARRFVAAVLEQRSQLR